LRPREVIGQGEIPAEKQSLSRSERLTHQACEVTGKTAIGRVHQILNVGSSARGKAQMHRDRLLDRILSLASIVLGDIHNLS